MTDQSINILLIEHNKNYASILKQGIELFKHTSLTFGIKKQTCINEAKLAITSDKPDIILLDLSFPGEDPISLLKQIKKYSNSIKIIAILTNHDENLIKQALNNGVSNVLVKGNFDADELLSKIGLCIGLNLNTNKLNLTISKKTALVNILVCSFDSEHAKRIQKMTLEDLDDNLQFSTHIALNKKETFNALEKNNHNLITVDLTNNDHLGLQLIRDITRHQYTQPIIVIVPENRSDLVKQAFLSGAHEYLFDEKLCCGMHLQRIIKLTLEKNELSKNLQAKTREQFYELINSCIESMILISYDGIIRYLNEPAKNLLIQNEASLIGVPFNFSFFHLEDSGSNTPSILSIKIVSLLASANGTIEIIYKPNSNAHKEMVCRVSQIMWDNQKTYLLAFNDITDIKRVAELKAEIQEKDRLEKLKNELIGVISHELRTPLTIIKTAVGNLKDGIVGELTDKQQKIVTTTDRSVDRLARMINNLLDMSRLESGRIKVNRHKMKIETISQDVIHNFFDIAKQKNISLNANIPSSLPFVYADPDMITQVLINLINNGLRYAKDNITLNIEEFLPENSKQKQIKISLYDNGTGIAPENLEAIFDKFQQIDRQMGGSGYKGTGLGLAICKQIIDLHNGQIWAESQIGSGATFHFTLPLYDVHDDFLDAFNQIIKKAEKSGTQTALIIIQLSNLDTIKTQATDKDIAWLFNDLSREIRNKTLRTTDFFHYRRDKHEFVLVFANTGKDTAKVIAKRINNLTKDCFCPSQKGKIYAELKMGISVYPEDATTTTELIQMTLEELKNQQ